jgi:hypothetical protein
MRTKILIIVGISPYADLKNACYYIIVKYLCVYLQNFCEIGIVLLILHMIGFALRSPKYMETTLWREAFPQG